MVGVSTIDIETCVEHAQKTYIVTSDVMSSSTIY